jgi:hypothetical protein
MGWVWVVSRKSQDCIVVVAASQENKWRRIGFPKLDLGLRSSYAILYNDQIDINFYLSEVWNFSTKRMNDINFKE